VGWWWHIRTIVMPVGVVAGGDSGDVDADAVLGEQQGEFGGLGRVGQVAAGAACCGGLDQSGSAQPGELVVECFGCADNGLNKRVQRGGACLDRAAAGDAQDPDGLDQSGAGLRGAGRGRGQRGTRSRLGIDRVRLAEPPGLAVGPVDLDQLHPGSGQEPCQAPRHSCRCPLLRA